VGLIALTIAASVAAGVLAERRAGVRAGEAARTLLRFLLYVLVPPVVFFNIARLEIDADVGAGIALGWLALIAAGGLAYLLGTRLLRLEPPAAGTLTNLALQGNTGYLGLPLCAAFLGRDSLSEAVAYDALVQGPVLFVAVFGVGAALGTRAGEGVRERLRAFVIRNPPLLAALAALLAPDALAPDALVDASRVLVYALLPLGFLAVGVTLAEEAEEGQLALPRPFGPRHRLRLAPRFDRRVAAALVFRLVVAPLLLLALAAPLIDLPGPYLLLAAMPAGVNGLVVAHEYGLDLGLAASAIAWSTVVVVVVALVAGALT